MAHTAQVQSILWILYLTSSWYRVKSQTLDGVPECMMSQPPLTSSLRVPAGDSCKLTPGGTYTYQSVTIEGTVYFIADVNNGLYATLESQENLTVAETGVVTSAEVTSGGGGVLWVVVSKTLIIYGSIKTSTGGGSRGNIGSGGSVAGTGGGGSGGSIFISTDQLEGHGPIEALDNITVLATNVHVKGPVHAVHVNITAKTLIIDVQGSITGDHHGLSCSQGTGFPGLGPSGAGHGGSGGRGSAVEETGSAYGDMYQPQKPGCHGGTTTGGSGGRGGGTVWLNITSNLIVNGHISCNGEHGTNGNAGGSGGSVLIHAANIQGYGKVEVNGGDGSSHTVGGTTYLAGGGSGGRLAVYYTNTKTYSGNWSSHGGLGGAGTNMVKIVTSDGSPGTMFFYHTGSNHSTLVLNNNMRGPTKEYENEITNYQDLLQDWGHAWVLLDQGGNNEHRIDVLQIYGQAQLAFLMVPDMPVKIHFGNMIGDRTGAVHVGTNQIMDFYKSSIDLSLSVYVYDGGELGLALDTHIRDIIINLNGTLANVHHLTVHDHGRLYLHSGARSKGAARGKFGIQRLTIHDCGVLQSTNMTIIATNINIGAGGTGCKSQI